MDLAVFIPLVVGGMVVLVTGCVAALIFLFERMEDWIDERKTQREERRWRD